MDVNSAFVNGDLEEEVYMTQPQGFQVIGKEHEVCRLTKAFLWPKTCTLAMVHKD